MKRIVSVLLALGVLAGCDEKGKQFTVSSTQKKLVYCGDTVTFGISSAKGRVPDSVSVFVDGKEFRFAGTGTCPLNTGELSPGDKSLKILVYGKGRKETHLRSMRVLSDIVPARLRYEVVATYPHRPDAYTQGLQLEGGKLYESTGLYGESSLRLVDLKSGRAEREIALDSAYFAEGLAVVGDSLFQLTWREQKGFVYDKHSFERIGEFSYPTEGWGMCHDGTFLVVSDGSEYLYFYDPATFSLHHKVAVFNNLGAVSRLNELEFVEGFVYANIYQSDMIVKINPKNGKVAAEVDFSGLLPQACSTDVDVLNGIAWNPATDHFYVTGKLWPLLFEVRLLFEE